MFKKDNPLIPYLDLENKKFPYQKLNQNQANSLKFFYNNCNDRFFSKIEIKSGSIKEISWGGHLCLVAKGSTNFLIEQLLNKKTDEAKKLLIELDLSLKTNQTLKEQKTRNFFSFLEKYPSRKKCVQIIIDSFLQNLS